MLNRRDFIGSIMLPPAAPAAGLPARAGAASLSRPLPSGLADYPGTAEEVAQDENFWFEVQQSFTVDRSIMNLNNGGVCPAPAVVQNAMKRHLDFSNTAPAYVLWRVLEPQKESVRSALAMQWGVSPEEVAITRNASESLQICQLGIDLQRGDEVLTTTQDYGRMLTTFEQRARREGIVLKKVTIPIPCEDPALIVRTIAGAMTDKTRIILISHIINITGQVMPAREVVEMARARGVPVIIDGAHALAQIEFKISDLNCDYYGVSLHKWLFAPHGTGLLYVRRDKVRGLWPMMAAAETLDNDIRKFEEIGTHPAANFLAIAEALTFHQGIGGARKEARLRFLRNTWAERLIDAGKGRVRLHTSLDPKFSCAIGTVQVNGIDSLDLANHLWDKHKILTVAIKHEEFEGVRVTPCVYTTMQELDRFCGVMEGVIRDGIPV